MTGGGREGGRQIKSNAEIWRDSSSKCFCLSLWRFLEREKKTFLFGLPSGINAFVTNSLLKLVSDALSHKDFVSLRPRRSQRTSSLSRKTAQLLFRWCKTANSLSISLIKQEFASLVLHNTFLCVALGHFMKGGLSVWKNRHAFDINYKQKLALTQWCGESSNQTWSCLKTSNICFSAFTHILQSFAKFLWKRFDGQNETSFSFFRWFWNNDRREIGGLGENVDSKWRY